MHLLHRAAATAALLLPLAVAPVTAQDYRGALGIYGGGVWFSDFNNDGDIDLNNRFFNGNNNFFNGFPLGRADLKLDAGWIVGAQGDLYFGNGRLGARLNFGYTERPIDVDGIILTVFDENDDFFDEFIFDDLEVGAVNTWFGDVNLMLRLLTPRADRQFVPYLTAGLGAVIYNLAGDDDFVFPQANSIWPGDDKTKFAGVFGIGADIIPSRRAPVAIRLEVVDHVAFDSPVEPIFGDDYDAVHNVRGTVGVHALFGRVFPPPVAVLPPPPPPAPPAPPPPPAEEALRVCVIDPTAPNMLRTVDALYVPTTRDTLVIVNGQRVELRQTLQPVPTARDASWFISGQPLAWMVNGMRNEFVPFGTARVIEPQDLSFLGTVSGLPVFADARDVTGIRAKLTSAQRTQTDLGMLMSMDEDIRDAIMDLDVLYVPLESVGCVFQPLQRVEEVRKVRG
ncbi:MAG TPA: outer membrane beta-barrel protein [Longimicrobiales bacterium]|nr:outer membrane beta-barrel protein [Longimicrobiales bacterium]